MAFYGKFWISTIKSNWESVIFFFIITKVWLSDWVLRDLVASTNFEDYFTLFFGYTVSDWKWVKMNVRLTSSQRKKMDNIQSKNSQYFPLKKPQMSFSKTFNYSIVLLFRVEKIEFLLNLRCLKPFWTLNFTAKFHLKYLWRYCA